jgi:hypothetical protein
MSLDNSMSQMEKAAAFWLALPNEMTAKAYIIRQRQGL